MAEQPEQVLPQQRIAAARYVEEGHAGGALQLQQDAAEDQRRKAHHDHHRHHQDVPGVDRHLVQRHAAGPGTQDRYHQLDTGRHRGNLHEGDAQQPEVRVHARRVRGAGQRRVHEPPGFRRHVEKNTRQQNDSAEQVAEVAQRRQPREYQIAGAEHLRNQVDRQALHHRHGEEEHHHRAVHGEDLVVDVRLHQLVAGQGELGADQHRQQAADEEEHPAGNEEAQADAGVVDDGQRLPAARVAPDLVELVVQLVGIGARGAFFVNGAHGASVSSQSAICSRVSSATSSWRGMALPCLRR